MKRTWTESDKVTLQRLYGKVPTAELARRLDTTALAVRMAAKRFARGNLQKPHCRFAEHRERLLELHATGLSTPALAAALGVPLRTVQFWLPRLGLRGNGWCEGSGEQRQKTRMANWLARNDRLVWWALTRVLRGSHGDLDAVVAYDLTLGDIYGHVTEELLRRAPSYNGRRSRKTTWVPAMIRWSVLRLFRNLRRDRWYSRRDSAATRAGEKAFCKDRGDDYEQAQALWACLDRLDPGDAELLRRSFGDDQTIQQLADKLGVKKWRATELVREALCRLRLEFQRECIP